MIEILNIFSMLHKITLRAYIMDTKNYKLFVLSLFSQIIF